MVYVYGSTWDSSGIIGSGRPECQCCILIKGNNCVMLPTFNTSYLKVYGDHSAGT